MKLLEGVAVFKRREKLLGVLLALMSLFMAIMGCIYVQLNRDTTPSVLTVHGDSAVWQRVEINEQTFLASQPPVSTVSLSPISHGPYVIHIQFADGRSVWASYFHLDAGVRGQTDIFVSHASGSPTVKFRCVIHKRPAVLSNSETVFDGSINASETSAEHPAILSGV